MILLEEVDTEFGHIKIIKTKYDGRCSYYQDTCFHSQITPEGISTSAYVHVMYSIIRQAEARKVLMIGCAGGTLATMLHRAGCKVTVVDINPHAFTFAKKYFQLPEDVECIVEDGWSYLLKTGKRYDAIAIDAFDGDGTVPEKFTTEDFFIALKEVLSPFGVVTMNVMVKHDMDMFADRIALAMEAAKLPVILFDWLGLTDHNTIIAGGITVKNMLVVPYKKPPFVRSEMEGILRRRPRKSAVNKHRTYHQ